MNTEKYIDELYENYNENFERGVEYQKATEKLEKKFDEVKVNFTESQLKDIEEFEQSLLNLLEMETKMAFRAGFKVAFKLKKEMDE